MNSLPWWITKYSINAIWPETRGEGVKVAVIDTGLNYKHPSILQKQNISYYNIIGDSSRKEDCMDEFGHGSRCAGMIAGQGPEIFGVAPEAELLIIKADTYGDMKCADVSRAIDYAVNQKAHIISLSCQYDKDEDDLPLLKQAVYNANHQNVLLVACTGNSSKNMLSYPGAFVAPFSVGASKADDHLSRTTTINSYIDILAPGEDITLMNTGSSTIEDDGTSYAAPYVAGVAALLLSYLAKEQPFVNVDFIKNILKEYSINKEIIHEDLKSYANAADIPVLGVISACAVFNEIKSLKPNLIS